ncbi:MAG: hypothetical protein ACR2O7_11320 [Parasphingorhabdus sp.]
MSDEQDDPLLGLLTDIADGVAALPVDHFAWLVQRRTFGSI